MATADELLAMMNSDGNENGEFVIDSNFRTISIPANITNLGVTSDNDVHRLYFRMPRVYCDTDLSTFNIRINYMNANNDGDIYVVTDKRIDETTIAFSWLVGQNALAYAGDVRFIVCLIDSDAEGTVLREFNTTVTYLPVLEGLEVDPSSLEGDLHDILEQLQNLSVEKVTDITTEGSTQIEKVKAEGSSQIAKVHEESLKQQANLVEKGKEVLATIPEDYQNVVKLAKEAVHTKADAIVSTVEGNTIAISDASDDLIRELKLFGKTEQFSTTGAQLFNAFGKQNNKFGTVTIENDGTKITVNGTYYVSWPISLKAGNNYYVNFKAQSASGYIGIRFEYSNNEVSDIITKPSTFTPVRNVVSVYLYASMGTKNSVVYENVQINKGSSPLKYEPYTGEVASPNPDYPQEMVSIEQPDITVSAVTEAEPQSPDQVIPLPYSLHGYRVTSGGNYTDSNGQQWICDEIDFGRGVYVKRICYADLTKASIVTEVYSGITRFVARSSEIKAGRAAGIGLCNAFHVGIGPVSENVSDNTISCFYAGNAVYWRCDACATADEMKTFVNNLGIIYMYPLLEPIEIPLTADEITAFKTLHTNYPNTAIMNNAGTWMSVEYHADTKTWISNLIDEKISAAMSYVPH